MTGLAIVLLFLFATPAAAAPPIWRASLGRGEAVLFGSVHLLPPAADWRSPALEAALGRAQAVWFEVPLDPASEARAGAAGQAVSRLPEGERLSDRLTRADAGRLRRVAEGLGAWPLADRLRPWAADVTLTTLYVEHRGGRLDLGVDRQLRRALPSAVAREAFETIDQQVALFTQAPEDDQRAALRQTLAQIEEDPAGYDRLLAAWLRGDAAAVEREAVEPLRLQVPGAYARFVADRNRRWAPQLIAQLRAGRRVLVVVGIGHLVGPDSLPVLLRRAGARVEGPAVGPAAPPRYQAPPRHPAPSAADPAVQDPRR